MSTSSVSLPHPPLVEAADFCIVIDAPHITIVFADGRYRGRVQKTPSSVLNMVAVASYNGLFFEEVVDPGHGELEITFRGPR